ncbi:PilW family protein [Desulfatibacillum aliphaticivorans]|uniref:PilW family protein n=1 Tax=Desulfatibacillum aliphaticivorans TaxID=218208 RepID=UPI0004076C74|nr:prepilin-type N-terminal cleavage/methylation domain-containing protein [Desulfatibacillum aliphaticivorans]
MRKQASILRSKAGVTLLELLIYLMISGIVAASISSMMSTTVASYQRNQNRLVLKQDIRAAINMITKDLRLAGCDPKPLDNSYFGICVADDQSIRVTSDFLPDKGGVKTILGATSKSSKPFLGDTKADDVGEDVLYYLVDDMLVREAKYEDNARHVETVLENVTSLNFDYLVRVGVPATMTTTTRYTLKGLYGLGPGLPIIDGANFVRVEIEARSPVEDRLTGEFITLRGSAIVCMRNLIFDPL